ncbi:unnamed protein product [Discosporangium mesarthrocarpum]
MTDERTLPLFPAQRSIFDAVTTDALQQRGGIFMVDSKAGTEKTFTECTVAAELRSRGKLVLCAASTVLPPSSYREDSLHTHPSGCL